MNCSTTLTPTSATEPITERLLSPLAQCVCESWTQGKGRERDDGKVGQQRGSLSPSPLSTEYSIFCLSGRQAGRECRRRRQESAAGNRGRKREARAEPRQRRTGMERGFAGERAKGDASTPRVAPAPTLCSDLYSHSHRDPLMNEAERRTARVLL